MGGAWYNFNLQKDVNRLSQSQVTDGCPDTEQMAKCQQVYKVHRHTNLGDAVTFWEVELLHTHT